MMKERESERERGGGVCLGDRNRTGRDKYSEGQIQTQMMKEREREREDVPTLQRSFV